MVKLPSKDEMKPVGGISRVEDLDYDGGGGLSKNVWMLIPTGDRHVTRKGRKPSVQKTAGSIALASSGAIITEL